ncbi:CapA family protein [Bacillus sp. Marseille-P3661]|uniref:CapA family protein n=1 Tax=Bacillus sp. Marseille-P3661 TaxID=1936234 RepID=UPI000C84EDDA|nr:CapA family protein [Bacillus sp. Marseille-P3661]
MDKISLLNVADIILASNSEPLFSDVKPTLLNGDVVVGQLEVPYTTRHQNAIKLDRPPESLQPLVSCGFDLVTLAGNHLMDAGVEGVEDTTQWLRDHGIHYVGAGMNIKEARQSVIIDHKGTRIGYLNYNCVGPEETWAGTDKPGCAYVKIITHYELDHATPGGPPSVYTWAERSSLETMKADIQALREQCDVLVVALHKGLGHTPVKIADYEKEVSYAAVDAGADLIVGHHAHILRGIEFYKGKPIFHGLCNFVAYAPILAANSGDAWAKRRRELFGFEPDPDYPTYPFHPEAIYTMIAQCVIEDGKIIETSYIPLIIDKESRPLVMKNDSDGQRVFNYVEKITAEAGLNAGYAWLDDRIIVYEKNREE